MPGSIAIPSHLTSNMRKTAEGCDWLDQLPDVIMDLQQRWDLCLGDPYAKEASCSWVAPCLQANSEPAVLKIGFPHMEAESEIDGMLLWRGEISATVYKFDRQHNAMLLEKCEPGITLRHLPESSQDLIVARLLKRLWRPPTEPHSFRHLSEMLAKWSQQSEANESKWADRGLTQAGLALFKELPASANENVLLATDLHAGNILKATRQPWLVIDPKPFVGDPAYDATQHLLNCLPRLKANPLHTIRRFSEFLEIEYERILLWTFARLVSEPSRSIETQQIARTLKI